MQQPPGTLEPNGTQGRSVPDEHTTHRARTPRFAFASGSRPLEGYTIKRGIGVGGFGEVYYATSDGGKEVALKRIQRNLDIELRGVRQCLNIKHPNLLSLFDIKYDDEEQAWVVMEFVSGESLQELIKHHPHGLAGEELHRWFDGITAGVEHLHDCGIVHRDLKPGNVFWDETGVKVGDYGLSKFISCSRRSGQTQSVGTFHYMAPEIGQGRYGKEIDIYALGIILYEMLTGHVPFDGESSQEIIMKHLTAEPNLDNVREPYASVIRRALAKDPVLRFRSVGDMRAALAGATAGGDQASSATAPTAASSGKPIAAQLVGGATATAKALPEEPIAKAVQTAWKQLADGWRDASFGTVTRFVILLVAVVLFVVNVGWLLPYAFVLVVSYAVYLLIRGVVLSNHQPTTKRAPVAAAGTPASTPGTSPRERPAWYRHQERRRRTPRRLRVTAEQLRGMLADKPVSQAAKELTGSLLMAAVAASVIGLIFTLLSSIREHASFVEWGPTYGWLVLTSLAGAWGVLLVSKSWDVREGDPAMRRFVLLVVGLLTGLFSYGVQQLLIAEPTYLLKDLIESEGLLGGLHEANGMPKLGAFLVFFAGLFFAVRFWKQADPVRQNRLSVWGTLLTVFIAVIAQTLCPIPRGFMIAATTALAIQLSAPWVNRERRRMLIAQYKANQEQGVG